MITYYQTIQWITLISLPLLQLEPYWVAEMNLYLGLWQGTRENRTGYWLRWWDEQGHLLLWGSELAEQERQRAERLAAQLRAAGIEPEV